MAVNRYTEVTNRSWFSRIGGAIKAVLFGLLLFVISFPILFINEGRSVKTYKRIKEAGGQVITVAADTILPENAQKLVHVTGKALTDSILKDPTFGVSASALKLRRSVEMFQWTESSHSEKKKKLGGGEETTTTYTYNTEWSSRVISSSQFKKPEGHQNPTTMPFASDLWTAADITVGAFTLSPSLVDKINNFTALAIPQDLSLPGEFAAKATLQPSGLYLGPNPASPTVGDTRIMFEAAEPTDVSVIAVQTGNTFEPYQSKVGGTFERLQIGIHSADAMIEKAQDENKMLTWVLRLVGFVVMMVGLNMVFRPLSVLADVIPILGSIVGAGTGLIAFLIAASFSFTTIAIAWVTFRPMVGIPLLVLAGGLAFTIVSKMKANKPLPATADA